MNTNIVIVLCEGIHDVRFIGKIIENEGFICTNKTKLKEFPKPLDDYFKREITKANIDDLNIENIREATLPVTTYKKLNSHFFLYSLKGDSQKIKRTKLIEDIYKFIPNDKSEISEVSIDTKFSVIYILDADNKGESERVKEINSELDSIFSVQPFKGANNKFNHNSLTLGYYIFTGSDNTYGKLEDILLPLMKIDNDRIFNDAEEYYNDHFDASRKKRKEDIGKSLIGITGQLQLPGASNTVCIKDSDYLTKEKISGSEKCVEIIEFFNEFI